MTTFIRRGLPVAVVTLLWVFIVRAQGVPAPDADGYFHLRMGHELLDSWRPWSVGHLGPFDSAGWVPTQWLPQIAMAATEDAGGLQAVLWLSGAVSMVLVLALYAACRLWAAPLPAALATAMAYIAVAPGCRPGPRP